MASLNGNAKAQRRRAGRRIASMGLALVLVLVACVFLGKWLIGVAAERLWMGPAVFDEIRFGPAKWRAAGDYPASRVRIRMFHDLRANHLKSGMTRAEVTRLLGKANEEDSLEWSYSLGPDALRMDVIVMVLTFDRFGRLVDVGWYDS